jgi:hypothetical protein
MEHPELTRALQGKGPSYYPPFDSCFGLNMPCVDGHWLTKQAAILAAHNMISTTYSIMRRGHVTRWDTGGLKVHLHIFLRIHIV